MEICGAYFRHHQDRDLFDYFHSHYRHFFPNLRGTAPVSCAKRPISGWSKPESGAL
jgi:hypothetical protein